MVRNAEDDVIWDKVKNVPKVNKPLAVFCGIINVILPGSGTITAACATPDEKVSKSQLIIGVLQFFLSLVLIGYVWSIYWSYLIIGKSFEIGEFAPGRTPVGGGQASVRNLNGRNQRSYQQFGGGGDIEGQSENTFLNNQRQQQYRGGPGGANVPLYEVNV